MARVVDPDQFDGPDDVEEAISTKVGEALDMNSQVIQILRDRASDFKNISEAYRVMMEWALDVSEMCAIKARMLADITGDWISSEYGLMVTEPPEEDDIEEDEDEDDNHEH